MPSLKDLRNRIASVKATRKITKAMQMVAAAKLRRAQESVTSSRPYASRMEKVLLNLRNGITSQESVPLLLSGSGRDRVHLLVVMTAERGLCGGFNSSIARLARQDVLRLQEAGKTVKLLCVGRKGYDILKRQFSDIMMDRIDLKEMKQLAFSDAEDIANNLLKKFEGNEFDVCTIYFSEFISVISQKPTSLQLIPARISETSSPEEDKKSPELLCDFEPSEGEILDFLLNRNIATQLLRGLLENSASEQGARMTAMDNATRNAGDMIDKLTINYNRQRQAQITKELIEIISGAEAL
ncbi:MAG: F0F1 ATP synthase subunit gamma [Hyphomicrobiaceae bacterium]|nr:F0F1 ATP synthase subunit gamma [Hyphomicrobiaceae bacterium]